MPPELSHTRVDTSSVPFELRAKTMSIVRGQSGSGSGSRPIAAGLPEPITESLLRVPERESTMRLILARGGRETTAHVCGAFSVSS